MSDVVIGQGSTTLDYLRIRHEWLGQLIDQGIAERDALKARVAELETVLKPFAEYVAHLDANNHPDEMGVGYYRGPNITVGDCRRAAEVLAKGERDE